MAGSNKWRRMNDQKKIGRTKFLGGFAASPDLRLKGHPTKINSGVHCCAIRNTDSFTGSTYPENGILQVQTNLRATKKASGSEFKNHCWHQMVLSPIFLKTNDYKWQK